MDIVNFDYLVNAERILTYKDVNLQEDYIILGKHDPRRRDFKATDYPVWAIPASEVFGYNEIRDENVILPHRQIIDFQGAGVTATDDPINKKTIVTIPGGGSGTGGATVSIKTSIDLNSTNNQTIVMPATGLYIIETAFVTNASGSLAADIAKELKVVSAGSDVLTSEQPGPPGTPDLLSLLFIPTNYVELVDAVSCWPPPCNGNVTVNGGVNLTAVLTTPFGVPATADLYLILRKLA